MTRDDFKTLVASMVRDPDGHLSDEEQETAIDLALTRYDQDDPKIQPIDVTAPGGKTMDPPAEYVPGFSQLRDVETPPDQVPPRTLARSAFTIYTAPLGDKILFASDLSAGQPVRLHMTVPHTMDEMGTTVPRQRIEAVACWAAALLLDQLASLFSGDMMPTIQSDSVDHQSKSRDYSIRASERRNRYFKELGIDPKRNAAAGVVVALSRPSATDRAKTFLKGI